MTRMHFGGNTPEFIGNPTECAMLVAAHKSGVEYASVRNGFIIKEQGEISVHCHYCNTDYKFGQDDIDKLFK